MKKIYSTIVKNLGPMAEDFIGEKMIILFNENAPAELAEFCVLHTGNELTDTVEVGDILKINDTEYKIVEVGCEVQKNLKDLGHIALRFNNSEEGESLEGSLYLEDKAVSLPSVGSEIAIFKA